MVPVIAAIDRVRRVTPYGDEIAYRLGEAWVRVGLKQLDEQFPQGHRPAAALVSSAQTN